VSDYLLDTNIIRYWYDTRCSEHKRVLARVQQVRQPDPQTQYVPRLFVSVVTVGEIEYGHRVVPKPDASKQSEFLTFLRDQCPEPLEVIAHVGEHYGKLKAWLFNNFSDKRKRTKARRLRELIDPTTGEELGADESDLWIVAQAITFNLVLVTHDSGGHFGDLLRRFSTELRAEDWAR